MTSASSQSTAKTDQLKGLATGDLSVIDTLMRMHEGTFEASRLDPATFQLVRLAALATLDAAPMSWLVNLTLDDAAGVTPDMVVGTLIAIAPVIGTARIVSAAGGVLRAMGIAIDLEAEAQAQAAQTR